MKEVNEIENKKEVEFLKDSKIVLKNEVRDFKEGTKHKFENDVADKLVSQKVAKYIDKTINSNTKNNKTDENPVEIVNPKNSKDGK